MKVLKALAATALLALATTAHAVMPQHCTGKFFNPITDTDWNTIFPITIVGAEISNGTNQVAPLMRAMPPVCVCPTVFGYPFVGVGITYWEPKYISEIERRAGCMSSIGGVNVLESYSTLSSETSTSDFKNQGEGANRMQVHWYEYPIFSMLDMMTSVQCKSTTGFNMAYITEVDPMWQDDTWGAIFAPEASLFTHHLAHAACAIDAVASSLQFPMDELFWCSGHWGNVYPLSGNSSNAGDPWQMNNLLQGKFIARNHRLGLSLQTIGPSATCGSHVNPIWVKSQYRYNQVAPIIRKGRAVATGDFGRFFTYPPVTNGPKLEYSVNLIWQGMQCCMKGIP